MVKSKQRQTKKKQASATPTPAASPSAQAPTTRVAEKQKSASEDHCVLVRRRAYELYVQRGCRDGFALDDWLEAEREILSREPPV